MMGLFFDKEIDRLKRFYGEKAYGEERKMLMWDEFRGVKEEDFTMAIDQSIRDNRYPPLSKDLQKALSIIRERKWVKKKDDENDSAKFNPLFVGDPSQRFKQILKTFNENSGKVLDFKKFSEETALALESEIKLKGTQK